VFFGIAAKGEFGMSDRLVGKLAIVTGASRGIGRAIARRLADDGAIVAVHYNHNAAMADDLIREIERGGGKAFRIAADLSQIGQIESMFVSLDKEFTERSGAATFDILVNNVGIVLPDAGMSGEDFDRLVNTNIKSNFFVTQNALSRIRDGGRIINLSSVVADRAEPDFSMYAATKGAIKSMTRSLAAKLGPRGITVNAVQPGATATDFLGDMLESKEIRGYLEASTALGRIGTGDDIASAVAFLASKDAGWITGETVAVSGGMRL
jgi:3-oxoacyl-[acyl-carrier protein] reductase